MQLVLHYIFHIRCKPLNFIRHEKFHKIGGVTFFLFSLMFITNGCNNFNSDSTRHTPEATDTKINELQQKYGVTINWIMKSD